MWKFVSKMSLLTWNAPDIGLISLIFKLSKRKEIWEKQRSIHLAWVSNSSYNIQHVPPPHMGISLNECRLAFESPSFASASTVQQRYKEQRGANRDERGTQSKAPDFTALRVRSEV